MLAEEENSAGFARINRELIGKAEALDSPRRVVLDMDMLLPQWEGRAKRRKTARRGSKKASRQ